MERDLIQKFSATFGTMPQAVFSAPGRTELGGNHTDHQHGCVLAAAVDLCITAAVRKTDSPIIRVFSEGYGLCSVDVHELSVQPREFGTTAALVRGVAARICALGGSVGGFDAYVRSAVPAGSGLSSSAAFEVLLGAVLNCLYCSQALTAMQLAQIGQYAENTYFGKPCGLMDQTACALGGVVGIDFKNPQSPQVQRVQANFSGYALCIISCGADHSDLTDEYAAICTEMQAVSAFFGKQVLREVPQAQFYTALPQVRQAAGDRAALRAMHFFAENERVARQLFALERGDTEAFLQQLRRSGRSSWMYLQNVIPGGQTQKQQLALALALTEHLLDDRGACRVHGGGFAGTLQAFVPEQMLTGFHAQIQAVLGAGSLLVLRIRKAGASMEKVQ